MIEIKCPIGGCDIDFATMDDLYQHFLDNPHQMNFKYFYWEMYKKIHELIEKHKYVETEFEQVSVVAVLESLLEDKK